MNACHDFTVPELIEIEIYRQAAEAMVGRQVAEVDAHDDWFLKEDTTADLLVDELVGATFTDARRHGKLLLMDLDSGHRLGLRFGMTGRLIVDGGASINELLYSSHRCDPRFVRFSLQFVDGGSVEISDPRRLGGVTLDPSLAAMGPDAASVTFSDFCSMVQSSDTPIKARLLDQARIAGIGNLIADELLWRAGISPMVPSSSLRGDRLRRLHGSVIATIAELQRRGGSHLGDLMSAGARDRDGRCPRCGTAVRRATVGGRTTYWCPRDQR